jgi:acyl transferase domain-containing protein
MAAQGIENLPLRVAFAFHSPAMALAANALEHDLMPLPAPRQATLDIYSTVDGARATPNAFDAAYWGENVREPVRFMQAIHAMEQDGVNLFIEIAPHAILARSIQRTLGDKRHQRVVSTLYRGRDDVLVMGAMINQLFQMHYPVDWSRIHSAPAQCVRLPPYPFQRKSYWIDESAAPSIADTSSRSTTAAPRRETPTTTWVDTPPAPRASREVLDFLLTLTGRVFAIERRDIRPDLEIAKLAPDSLAFLEFMSQIEQTLGKRLSMRTIRDRARVVAEYI